ncbi:MAG TPA: hypothetical protein VNW71_00490 [Thermoanaerobaculia bacterium]|nr:hypothetical protein [Thermoanaerobaculia bacterium]
MIDPGTRCDRFESEALLLLEQGQPLDEHFSSCSDCLEARAAYDRLRGGFSSLGKEDEPPADWQARVWEQIERRKERRRRWAPWWSVPVGMAALAALFLIWIPGQRPASLQVEIESGATVRRGAEAHPGDLLRLAGATGGARHSELRVYRNDTELILRCSTEPPCSRRRGELTASVVLDGVGRYQPLLLLSEDPLPDIVSNLDTDTDAALNTGAEIEMGSEVVVR